MKGFVTIEFRLRPGERFREFVTKFPGRENITHVRFELAALCIGRNTDNLGLRKNRYINIWAYSFLGQIQQFNLKE